MNSCVVAGVTRMAHTNTRDWSPGSWKVKSTTVKRYMPHYTNTTKLNDIKLGLRDVPPLIFARETQKLKDRLANVQKGQGFVLQGGECAESVSVESTDNVIELVELLNEMSFTLSYYMELPVYTIARVAGQYAKPRSSATETRDGITLPSFMGTIVNSPTFDILQREPEPDRMRIAYRHASSMQMMIRSMMSSGFASPNQSSRLLRDGYVRKAARMFHRDRTSMLEDDTLYISHEALLLEYEECLTRMDRNTGTWFNTSAHMLWLGERTRFPNSAHVEYLSGIENPIGIKVGPSTKLDDLRIVMRELNPSDEAGKIVLIFRMGTGSMRTVLPGLIEGLKGESAVFMVDPMHGNTYECVHTRLKTRRLEAIFEEVIFFNRTCLHAGVHFGGVHLELSGSDDVLECVEEELYPDPFRYTTLCDPRLNASQSMRLVDVVVRECGCA